jgi:DNA-binding XRE family transcriptional regulator
MPDILMCTNGDCKDKNKCYRFKAIPDPNQRYGSYTYVKGCPAFLPILKCLAKGTYRHSDDGDVFIMVKKPKRRKIKHIGEAIRYTRINKGKTAKQLDEDSGVSKNTLYRLEKDGYKHPEKGDAKKMLELLAIHIDSTYAELMDLIGKKLWEEKKHGYKNGNT